MCYQQTFATYIGTFYNSFYFAHWFVKKMWSHNSDTVFIL